MPISKVYKWIKNNQLLSIPSNCVLCDQSCNRPYCLCNHCIADLPYLKHSCGVCALPLDSPTNILCGQCLQKLPSYNKAFSILAYQYPLDKVISDFKYQGKLEYGYNLARLASSCSSQLTADCLIPVPLHPKRQRQRGFNQATIIAQALSKHSHIPIAYDICYRIRDTNKQMELNIQQRKRNLRNAFQVKKTVKDKTIIVVDDVMTTGTTANEISKTLLRAGAKQVNIWTIARTPLY